VTELVKIQPLTTGEQADLRRCESAIRRAVQSWWEAADSLAEIRNRRLYRTSSATFEDYCQETWGLGRRYVNRMIEATATRRLLGPVGPKQPDNERQIRELHQLQDVENRKAAWLQAVEIAGEGRVTAAIVRQAVSALKQQIEPAPAPPMEEEGTDDEALVKSATPPPEAPPVDQPETPDRLAEEPGGGDDVVDEHILIQSLIEGGIRQITRDVRLAVSWLYGHAQDQAALNRDLEQQIEDLRAELAATRKRAKTAEQTAKGHEGGKLRGQLAQSLSTIKELRRELASSTVRTATTAT